MTMLRLVPTIGALACVSLLAIPGYCQQPANGGFETGNFSGWSLFGNTADTGVGATTPLGTAAAHSGSFGAFFGQLDFVGAGGIFQTLSTISGQEYTVSYWLRSGPQTGLQGAPSSFQAAWNGAAIASLINPGPLPFTQSSFVLTATGNTTELRFSFTNNADYFMLDDVSVVPRSTGGNGDPGAVVPEPASIWIFAMLGLALAAGTGRGQTLAGLGSRIRLWDARCASR